MEDREIVEGLMRPERWAHVIGQSPRCVRDDISALVDANQIPGSFGDLIKRSIDLTKEHKTFDGTNVVSMMGRRVEK